MFGLLPWPATIQNQRERKNRTNPLSISGGWPDSAWLPEPEALAAVEPAWAAAEPLWVAAAPAWAAVGPAAVAAALRFSEVEAVSVLPLAWAAAVRAWPRLSAEVAAA